MTQYIGNGHYIHSRWLRWTRGKDSQPMIEFEWDHKPWACFWDPKLGCYVYYSVDPWAYTVSNNYGVVIQ